MVLLGPKKIRRCLYPISLERLTIYDAIIRALIPIVAIGKEQSSDLVARYEKITKLKKEIEKEQKQVDNERQSKRRFELNAELKTLKEELTKLEK